MTSLSLPRQALQAIHRNDAAGIAVWRLAWEAFDRDEPGWWMALLSQAERQRLRRYHFERDRVRFGATRAALRLLLGERLGARPEQLAFSENRYGKPLLAGGDIAFNVSHSGRFGLIATAERGCVGVDIEQCNPTIDALELAQHFFARAEVDVLRRCGERARERRFFRIWTAKEAALKAAGLGIGEHLASFSVLGAVDEPFLSVAAAFADRFGALRLRALTAPPGYMATLAFAP